MTIIVLWSHDYFDGHMTSFMIYSVTLSTTRRLDTELLSDKCTVESYNSIIKNYSFLDAHTETESFISGL